MDMPPTHPALKDDPKKDEEKVTDKVEAKKPGEPVAVPTAKGELDPKVLPLKPEVVVGKEAEPAGVTRSADEKPRGGPLGKRLEDVLKDTRITTLDDGKKGLPTAPVSKPSPTDKPEEKGPPKLIIVPGDQNARPKRPWYMFWKFW
jgi:hypothetical protein